MSACSEELSITKPPIMESNTSYSQRNSFIQIPITIDTQDIKKAIFTELKNPISVGSTEKFTTDIFAVEEISKKEFTDNFWKKPVEMIYKYTSKDISNTIDDSLKIGAWVNHKVFLTKLDILFEGTLVKIFTSYKVEISGNYEQRVLPFTNPVTGKGIFKGTVEADISLVGEITIDEKAQIHIEPFKDQTKIKFKKILFPAYIDALNVLKVTGTKEYFTEEVLEDPINKYIFEAVEKQITKTRVDLNLAQKIQEVVQDNAYPLHISKDLWLIPEAQRVSISQVNGQGSLSCNTLSINLGIVGKPKLITSASQPIIDAPKNVPVVCEKIDPKIYLYPRLNVPYRFVQNKVQEKLKKFILKKYPNTPYTLNNVKIYPSNDKLVMAIDLLDKEDQEKLVTFYLWGVPTVDKENMLVKLKELDYTIESKNYLLHTADWLLDTQVKKFLQEKTVFSYEEEFLKLSRQIKDISYESHKKIITGQMKLVGVENLYPSKDALIVHTLATGDLSYKINLKESNASK